jgi:hypothetical protein
VPELSPELVDRALAEATKRAANLDYFFDTLSSPDWIGPLRDRGLFAEPPAQTVSDEGYVLAPGWSASRYLARMAGSAPRHVAHVIRTIETDNERVHEDFADAALAMPLEEARAVAAAEAAWIAGRDHIYYLLPRKVIELAVWMADLGEVEVAIALTRSLFAPSDVPSDAGWGLKRPQARFSDWEYDQLLRKVVESVVPAAPAAMMRELVELLGRALDLMRSDGTDEKNFDLTSRVWRVRIADDRDRATQAEEALVSAVRDAARSTRAGRLLPDSELVGILTARPEELLRRIAMDALVHEPEADLDVVRALVVDPETLASAEPSVEFRELLTANASRLPRGDIELLVAALRGGPDAERYREGESRGREVTDEEVGQYVAWWRAARLKLLLPALDETELAEYESLVAVAGDADLPVSFEVRTFYGPTSPVTVEELEELGDAELLERLRTWDSDGRWGEPSVEGFARTLAAFVQRHPERIGALAPGLRDVRPGFAQWTLEGLEAALREGKGFDWAPVIDLMRWIVEQPREIPEGRRDDYGDLDPGWVWTRREIVSLLERGLKLEDDRAIAAGHRDQVWYVIGAVAADPDPTPEHEERYGGSNMDPLTLALNTTRPRAIFAAVAYGVWLSRILQLTERKEGANAPLFAEAPELAHLLEEHLDASADPSVAVRAAIGHFFANLLVLDAAWAQDHAAQIFPGDDSPLREAAWGAYVIYTPPYDNVFSALRVVYERSAELAGESRHGFRWDETPTAKLGEHLATFYWRGTIELDDLLLQTYWEHAPSEARRHVIDFLGRSVRELPELEGDVEARLLAFWDFARGEAARAETLDDLAPFAWWFASEALPLAWRVDNLLALLHDKVKPDPAFVVAEELPAVAQQEPLRAVEALRRLLELEREGWSFDAWRDEIEQVLRHALDAGDPDARGAAEDAAHWLGALGYREFRALLD